MKQAGGFIIQLMPFTEEAVIEKLEENLKNVTSVTELLEKGHTPESLLETLLAGFDLEINEKVPTQFHCNCTKAVSYTHLDVYKRQDMRYAGS